MHCFDPSEGRVSGFLFADGLLDLLFALCLAIDAAGRHYPPVAAAGPVLALLLLPRLWRLLRAALTHPRIGRASLRPFRTGGLVLVLALWLATRWPLPWLGLPAIHGHASAAAALLGGGLLLLLPRFLGYGLLLECLTLALPGAWAPALTALAALGVAWVRLRAFVWLPMGVGPCGVADSAVRGALDGSTRNTEQRRILDALRRLENADGLFLASFTGLDPTVVARHLEELAGAGLVCLSSGSAADPALARLNRNGFRFLTSG